MPAYVAVFVHVQRRKTMGFIPIDLFPEDIPGTLMSGISCVAGTDAMPPDDEGEVIRASLIRANGQTGIHGWRRTYGEQHQAVCEYRP